MNHVIMTIPEKCRVCYTCVRECPAKAIRIHDGQAQVIEERCIACGHCTLVCSQGAKVARNDCMQAQSLLEKETVTACIAPSFPAHYQPVQPLRVIGALKALGFSKVIEVAFGADIVAREYERIHSRTDQCVIHTSCPSSVMYVEKFHPSLVKNLCPVASPMIVAGRILKRKNPLEKIVFIGPCFAKKLEAQRFANPPSIDCVLTFKELDQLFFEKGISVCDQKEILPDPPRPGSGLLFPLKEGVLSACERHPGVLETRSACVQGASSLVEIMEELEKGDLKELKILDPHCCEGCISGPGMKINNSRLVRHTAVSSYIQKRLENPSEEKEVDFCALDTSATFKNDNQKILPPSEERIRKILSTMGKYRPEDELNCTACGYHTCREHATAIHKGLAEEKMCLPWTIEQLKTTAFELKKSYQELEETKDALAQHEKLASMGQLSAGIAHEINNPLGIILLYANLLLENCQNPELKEDLEMIVSQSSRCKHIVGGLLDFSRKNKIEPKEIYLDDLLESCIKTIRSPENIRIVHTKKGLVAQIDPAQMSQVFINLLKNSVEALEQGGMISVTTRDLGENVEIEIHDNGCGISDKIKERIFEPFFTTKQIGKGTGLGLSVSYGIIKMHRGSIRLTTNADPRIKKTFTQFQIQLPKHQETEFPVNFSEDSE